MYILGDNESTWKANEKLSWSFTGLCHLDGLSNSFSSLCDSPQSKFP